MGQGIPSGYVLPTPQRAKLVGTLNIIFAVLILMYIAMMLAFVLLQPLILEWSQGAMKMGQAQVEKQLKDRATALKKEIAEAKTDPEKAELKRELDALEATPQPKMPDLKELQDQVMTPGYKIWVGCDLLSGLVLNLAMLSSGIGLMRLRERGRRVAIWTFGLKLARLAIVMLVAILVIVPMTSKMSAEVMKGIPQAKATPFPLGDMAKFQAVVGTVTAIVTFAFGSVWPVIGLVLLTRPGTRAACRASAPKPVAPETDLP